MFAQRDRNIPRFSRGTTNGESRNCETLVLSSSSIRKWKVARSRTSSSLSCKQRLRSTTTLGRSAGRRRPNLANAFTTHPHMHTINNGCSMPSRARDHHTRASTNVRVLKNQTIVNVSNELGRSTRGRAKLSKHVQHTRRQ